jgi:putative transposase
MAHRNHSEIVRAMTTLFSPQWLHATARQCGYLQRKRRLDFTCFFWCMLLAFAAGRNRTLAEIRRAYAARARRKLSRSAFYDRFHGKLAVVMKEALGRAFACLAGESGALEGRLARFKDLLLCDATVVRLHRFLAAKYPACRTNHTEAAVKLHTVLSVAGKGPRSVQVTKERANEGKKMKVGPWVAGRLVLFDLGYFCFGLFDRIRRQGGSFISRLKENSNPLIVKVNGSVRGRAVGLVGGKLQQALPLLRRATLDCEVEVSAKRRGYLGTGRTEKVRFRLVGVQDRKTGGYHLYLTDIPPEALCPADIAKTYRARWEIETLFKELKYYYRLDQLPSRRQEIVETLLYAALITVVVSRRLLAAIEKALLRDCRLRLKRLRWASVFATYSEKILDFVLRRLTAHGTRLLLRALKSEAVDPNACRPSLLVQVGAAVA